MGLMELKNINLEINNKKILNNLSIDFTRGDIHAVVGPNGTGKATLASVIMRMGGYRDIEGEITYNSENINSL